jgi:hypothetical protein
MPPPSPVWTRDHRKESTLVFFDATFQMSARIEGKLYESRSVRLKVKNAEKGERD